MPRPAAKSPETFFRYLPNSQRDRDWGIYVTTAGYLKIEPGMAYPPSGHPNRYAFSWEEGRVLDEYQLHYFRRGGGVLETKPGGTHQIEPGDFFLLFPGTWHRYAPAEPAGWDEYWIGFKGDQIDRLVENGFFSPDRNVFRSRGDHGAMDLFTEILSELRTQPAGFMRLVASHTLQLLAILLASSPGAADARAEDLVREAKHRLRSHLDRAIDLNRLAEELGVSYATLRQTFRRTVGLSLHQYHLQLRLDRAKQLLAVSGSTVKDVSRQIGFGDPYYFSRLFKRKTGHSPEGWKRAAVPRAGHLVARR